jgi:hypothetical protein
MDNIGSIQDANLADTYEFGSMIARDVKVRGYGFTEDEAFARAMRVADGKYEIITTKAIRKVRGQDAWDVTLAVRVR